MHSFYKEGVIEAGCDEAGRGCLAGPVVAAAVILPQELGEYNLLLKDLNDSKKLSEAKREFLRPIITECAVAFGIASCSPEEIDSINILNASILAMHRALDKAAQMLAGKSSEKELCIEHIIVDGNRFKPYCRTMIRGEEQRVPHLCIVKGDSLYKSIAAASILAKTERDHLMDSLHLRYPHYGWDKNKGYPTKAHREAIQRFGASPYHRKTFTLLPEPTLF